MARKKVNKQMKKSVIAKTSSRQKVPVGIAIIGSLFLLYGLILLTNLFIIGKALLNDSSLLMAGLSIGGLFLLIGVLSIVSAIGLFRLKKYGRMLTIAISAGLLVKLFVDYVIGQSTFATGDLIYILVLVIIILYLAISKKIKEAFK